MIPICLPPPGAPHAGVNHHHHNNAPWSNPFWRPQAPQHPNRGTQPQRPRPFHRGSRHHRPAPRRITPGGAPRSSGAGPSAQQPQQAGLWAGCLGQLAAVGNGDGLGGAARGGAQRLDLPHHVQAVSHLAEHDVLAVQPRGGHGADEELRGGGGGGVGMGGVSGVGGGDGGHTQRRRGGGRDRQAQSSHRIGQLEHRGGHHGTCR